jgi:hypothetical protein
VRRPAGPSCLSFRLCHFRGRMAAMSTHVMASEQDLRTLGTLPTTRGPPTHGAARRSELTAGAPARERRKDRWTDGCFSGVRPTESQAMRRGDQIWRRCAAKHTKERVTTRGSEVTRKATALSGGRL